MALHPHFPTSPYAPLLPGQRWFPADEAPRERTYEKLLLTTAPHAYPKAGRYVVAVKVIDIFGNDTTSLVSLTVG